MMIFVHVSSLYCCCFIAWCTLTHNFDHSKSILKSSNDIYIVNYLKLNGLSNGIPLSSYDDQSPKIIFVHGLLSSSRTFASWANYIKRDLDRIGLLDFSLLGVDCPCHGKSLSVDNVDYKLSAGILIEHLFKLGGERIKYHFVGHSTGAKLCTAVSLSNPSIVASITLIDSFPGEY